eukprot:CAMPEP_0195508974 /NCGR_PEP_ID=MMETSP0794_2-20130614/2047_1 /TAXON_ID=515487 /ORGANISM="Stephanopyxis turris, Strain CCMP 815" /LENGTH=146 /DNA_ID=CAMNT_0040636079 /DNA_START=297 /DNA_END=737 /DNA_ORIENTATION=-
MALSPYNTIATIKQYNQKCTQHGCNELEQWIEHERMTNVAKPNKSVQSREMKNNSRRRRTEIAKEQRKMIEHQNKNDALNLEEEMKLHSSQHEQKQSDAMREMEVMALKKAIDSYEILESVLETFIAPPQERYPRNGRWLRSSISS